jgi:hypothetical protein
MSMTKKSLLSALLIILTVTPVIGDEVTIDPNNYAPGQNISNVTPGVELAAMSVVPLANPQPGQTYTPQFSAVFASPVAPGCSIFGVPCSPIGNQVIGYSPVAAPSFQAILWGEGNKASQCIPGNGNCDAIAAPGLIFPGLVVNFDVPTDSVSVLGAFFQDDGMYVEAFNSAGQSIHTCNGYPALGNGCVSIYSGSFQAGGWANYTISDPTADISFLVVGGAANYRPIANVQYDAVRLPIPADLWLLVAGLLVIGVFHAKRRGYSARFVGAAIPLSTLPRPRGGL